MTVRIVQGEQDPRSEDREPILGEVGTVIGDDPEGPVVKLESGARGHVLEVVADA